MAARGLLLSSTAQMWPQGRAWIQLAESRRSSTRSRLHRRHPPLAFVGADTGQRLPGPAQGYLGVSVMWEQVVQGCVDHMCLFSLAAPQGIESVPSSWPEEPKPMPTAQLAAQAGFWFQPQHFLAAEEWE